MAGEDQTADATANTAGAEDTTEKETTDTDTGTDDAGAEEGTEDAKSDNDDSEGQSSKDENNDEEDKGSDQEKKPEEEAGDKDEAESKDSEYKVPDEYKDEPWAGKVKSEADLWKTVANLQKVIGKKGQLPDFEKASDEEKESFFAKTRPENKDVYNFGEGVMPELSEGVSQLLFDKGIPEYVGNEIIANYQEMEKQILIDNTSEENFEAEMVKSFGEKHHLQSGKVSADIDSFVSVEDRPVFDTIPNKYLGVVYRMLDKQQKAYGANESGKQGEIKNKDGGFKETNVEEVRADLRKQIREIDKRPHTAQEKKIKTKKPINKEKIKWLRIKIRLTINLKLKHLQLLRKKLNTKCLK